MRRLERPLLVILLISATAQTAYAGMPMVRLSDVARMRLDVISFFLVGLLLSAAAIHWLWNQLRTDFPRLPEIHYGKALGVVILWGLLFIVVLTMISGVRELMTPGAWEPDGETYRLRNKVAVVDKDVKHDVDLVAERDRQLRLLGHELQNHANKNDGLFPTTGQLQEFPPQRLLLPGPSQLRYVYVAGRTASDGAVPLAYEPNVFGGYCRVLLADGGLVSMAFDDLQTRLQARTLP